LYDVIPEWALTHLMSLLFQLRLPVCNDRNKPVSIYVGEDEIDVLTENGFLIR